jgi:hypothetical protein
MPPISQCGLVTRAAAKCACESAWLRLASVSAVAVAVPAIFGRDRNPVLSSVCGGTRAVVDPTDSGQPTAKSDGADRYRAQHTRGYAERHTLGGRSGWAKRDQRERILQTAVIRQA